MKLKLYTFTGRGPNLEAAIERATEKVNEFLGTHSWIASDGRSAYVIPTPDARTDGMAHVYIITLIGPPEEAPVRNKTWAELEKLDGRSEYQP